LGGVALERVHLTYSPRDWFNILAGRYLTPYGIWNIDHGSPVLLPVRPPYMQARGMVPRAQTGLQAFGRFFPLPTLFVDYAVTLSNGRGPMEQLFDLDENKGVGLRLRLSYQKKQVKIAVGGYGYYGTYTDTKKALVIALNPDYTLNNDEEFPVTGRTTITEAYREIIGSADFLLEVHGVRLQGEYVHRFVDYTKPARLGLETILLNQGNSDVGLDQALYAADFQGDGVYGLLAWELPLSRWLGPVLLTPYFMYEYGEPQDNFTGFSQQFFQVGLNVKPSAFVTLKLEYAYLLPNEAAPVNFMQYINAQLAVSF
jgi:hypothetical protein